MNELGESFSQSVSQSVRQSIAFLLAFHLRQQTETEAAAPWPNYMVV